MSVNLITNWRLAVQAHLRATFTEADVRGGQQTSQSHRPKALNCDSWPGWPTMTRDVSLANPTLKIRYFVPRSRQPNQESPQDESPLEQAAADLMIAFAGKRKAGDFVDDLACFVSVCTPNTGEWCVDVTLQAYALNLAASAA